MSARSTPSLAEPEPEVVGRHLGHRVRLVEHEKIVREKHAAGFALGRLAAGSPRLDQGEEQRVVDDDQVGRAQPGPRALIEAALRRRSTCGNRRRSRR